MSFLQGHSCQSRLSIFGQEVWFSWQSPTVIILYSFLRHCLFSVSCCIRGESPLFSRNCISDNLVVALASLLKPTATNDLYSGLDRLAAQYQVEQSSCSTTAILLSDDAVKADRQQ